MEFEEYITESKTDLKFDQVNIDQEIFEIPNLHAKWWTFYSKESKILFKLITKEKEVYKKCFRFYSGKESDVVYSKASFFDEIGKYDVKLYIEADENMNKIRELKGRQQKVVDFIESVLKMINNRGFLIRDAIAWRKFDSGLNY